MNEFHIFYLTVSQKEPRFTQEVEQTYSCLLVWRSQIAANWFVQFRYASQS